MKDYLFIGFLAFISLFIILQLRFINNPVVDNDEGIYINSLLLMSKGYLPYKQIFISQPPGFLLLVYPGFLLLGKTLRAARLTIFIWSFIGISAIVWLSFILKKKWLSIMTIALLCLIPVYRRQIIILQSDLLIPTLQAVALSSIFKFKQTFRFQWFLISTVFLNLSFWTKYDLSLIPFFLFIILDFKDKNTLIKLLLIISCTFFLIFSFSFGFNHIFSNTILLRVQASDMSPFSFAPFFTYLKGNLPLSLLIISCFMMPIFKTTGFPLIALWPVTELIFFIFYRPLFPHHFSMLVVSFSFLFSYLIYSMRKLYLFLLAFVLFISMPIFYSQFVLPINNNITLDSKKAVDFIMKNTRSNDMVVSDEGILNYLSGRLPPPELVDLSFVRIRSGNLKANEFAYYLENYKPKLIICWNGRLKSMRNFESTLDNYREIKITKNQYIYTRF